MKSCAYTSEEPGDIFGNFGSSYSDNESDNDSRQFVDGSETVEAVIVLEHLMRYIGRNLFALGFSYSGNSWMMMKVVEAKIILK